MNNGALLRSKWEREKQEEEEAWRLYHEEYDPLFASVPFALILSSFVID